MARPPRRWRHMTAGWNEGPNKEDGTPAVFLPGEHTPDNHMLKSTCTSEEHTPDNHIFESTCTFMIHLCISNSFASDNGVMTSIIEMSCLMYNGISNYLGQRDVCGTRPPWPSLVHRRTTRV